MVKKSVDAPANTAMTMLAVGSERVISSVTVKETKESSARTKTLTPPRYIFPTCCRRPS